MTIVEFTSISIYGASRVIGIVNSKEAERLINEAEGRIIDGPEADAIVERVKFIANPSVNATAVAVKKDS